MMFLPVPPRQGGLVKALVAIVQALQVPLEHRNVCKKVMRQHDRLRPLHVRIPRHENAEVFLGLVEKYALKMRDQLSQLPMDPAKRASHPGPPGRFCSARYGVFPPNAPISESASARWRDARLRNLPTAQISPIRFLLNGPESRSNSSSLGCRQNSACREHFDMGNAAAMSSA